MTKPLQRRPAYNHRARPLFWLLCLFPLAAQAAGQSAAPCAGSSAVQLHVTVTGARRVAGNVTFTLYGEDRSRFLAHHGSLAIQRVTLNSSEAEACFALSAPGIYAVATYHDENDNHHFDRTLLGLPAEGYGFSNNVTPAFGLPSFDSVRLQVGAGVTRIGIKLLY
jgi:uncharacterized protein (DUF2141 family)